jgi:chaperonin GroES
MKVNPIRDRILVKPIDAETKTASGLVIPDTATEKPNRGMVVALGTGKVAENGTIVPMVLKQGDTVLYGKFAGNEVKIDGDNHLVLNEDDVMAVVEGV